MKILSSFILLIFFLSTQSQERKSIDAYRFIDAPTIDGKLTETEWKNIKPAKNFVVWQPTTRFGKKIPDEFETLAYFGYDDKAIYIGGIMKHPRPYEIRKEFSKRDQLFGFDAEGFWVSFDTNDDKESQFSFLVTAAGAVADLFAEGEWSENSLNYDTVFDAKISFNENGWTTEMIIPYSALKFPEKNIQNWGINFGRDLQGELEEQFMWNPVDEKEKTYNEQMGLVNNIKDIDPPVRLFLYPYLQTSVNAQRGIKSSSSYSAGLDLKYGLTNSFTLDLTLIPDFGQVSFDDKELNLSPFEQQFSENRAFFTEGADLFRKADPASWRSGEFFYSRRIGQEINFDENEYLQDNEELISYDEKPNLINSVKVTGTTDKKLSIGFLNAITANAYAYFKNTSDNTTREELIAPLTNYNVLSLSQQFLNDFSSISFLNTNVNRKSGFNANNAALVLDLFDNKRKLNFQSNFFTSHSPRFSQKNGVRGAIQIQELKGNVNFKFNWDGVDKYYNQNELGFWNNSNFQSFRATVTYKIFEEYKILRNYNNYFFASKRYRYHGFGEIGGGFRFGNNFEFQNLWKVELDFDYTGEEKDYYEPRTLDRYIIDPGNYGITFGFDTNPNKKFSYGIRMDLTKFTNKEFDENKTSNEVRVSAKYKISNKLTLGLESESSKKTDDIGFLQKKDGEIHFGRRDIKSVENSLDLNFNIDNYKYLSLRFRNFWSTANYDNVLFSLKNDGMRELTDHSKLDFDPNTNFNLWNLDLNFDWWFSPGSTITIQYKNQIFNRDNESGLKYYKSLKNLFEFPIEHQLSLRINYLIDFNKLRRND